MITTDDAEILASLREHSDHPSGFLAYNGKTSHFRGENVPGTVAYRRGRRHVVQLCGPLTGAEHRAALLAQFRAWAASERLRICAVQLSRADAELYAGQGFAVNQLGRTYSVDLAAFTTKGGPLAKVRQNIARAKRDGVTVAESASQDDPRLSEIDARWLRAKGRHVKELDFMIGERGGRGAAHRRIFVASVGERPVAYISYSPAFGGRPGWLYDLTRRDPDSPVGTIELVNLQALQTFQAEGAGWLHLGHTPFAGLDAANEVPGAASGAVTRVAALIAEHGKALYPSRTQEAFKRKWAPHVVEPEYVAFEGGVSVPSLWNLLRLTRAI
ncbi:DUF2156 domain-containing protein [Actinosynnema pretiosum subsp. pretiosum]|uniref:Phosphatidylglycerol lysyltransferase C-terminal domain-containing protein n=2 Tax=Actinosynnema TaxID=40566 RepID=C6WBU1_ACTMD|nr:DUF2156 domain-containing protein [Actinosynnema mirum]ACU37508.1 protein of unknown function DUF470 [Actinosynnema mirum DSM 43827]AXX30988.1 hypothetical protein APASM_3623 [Actinosynnema pretiosum subsp. pretiosum]QUF04920.1 DUF2156 domain-containing protein [Actinosynnema pretiosum subsp. pretiosum]